KSEGEIDEEQADARVEQVEGLELKEQRHYGELDRDHQAGEEEKENGFGESELKARQRIRSHGREESRDDHGRERHQDAVGEEHSEVAGDPGVSEIAPLQVRDGLLSPVAQILGRLLVLPCLLKTFPAEVCRVGEREGRQKDLAIWLKRGIEQPEHR